MFSPRGAGLERGWPGRIDGDRVIQLAAQTLQSFFTGGGGAREHAEFSLADVELRAPVLYPPNVRVFQGVTLDFAFANTAAVVGPEETVVFPAGAGTLDFGLGFAAVIGAGGAIGGYTLANTWRAPQLPGAKQRDFALSIGPVVDTEADGGTIRASSSSGAAAEAEVDADWEALVAHAARNTVLRPGDLLVLDLGPAGARLEPGEAVTLAHEAFGALTNSVTAP